MKKNSVFQKYPIWCLVTGAIILFQIIWHIYMHEPWRDLDITMETACIPVRHLAAAGNECMAAWACSVCTG